MRSEREGIASDREKEISSTVYKFRITSFNYQYQFGGLACNPIFFHLQPLDYQCQFGGAFGNIDSVVHFFVSVAKSITTLKRKEILN